ncbi:MAG: TatD family hydrolase [Deltaproteobacteria bacterium]|nr:TatD family hydrolase [Deltaproteobacteria bacterium]
MSTVLSAAGAPPPRPRFFDSHCHLTDEPLAGRLEAVLARARRAGITGIMVPGYDLDSSRAAARLAGRHPGLVFAVGVHPGWLERETFPAAGLRRLAAELRPAAIGEIGLDFALPGHDPARQLAALECQLDLARELELPVILHCRRAFQPLYDLLVNFPGLTGVLHAFNGGPEMAAKFLARGFHLAFGGGVTRPNARKIRRTVPLVPGDHLLLETDAPYIGGHEIPADQMEPARLPLIAAALAALKNWDLEETARRTTANARRLFRLEEG